MKLKTKDMIYAGAFAALLMAEICMALGKYKSKKYNYFWSTNPVPQGHFTTSLLYVESIHLRIYGAFTELLFDTKELVVLGNTL